MRSSILPIWLVGVFALASLALAVTACDSVTARESQAVAPTGIPWSNDKDATLSGLVVTQTIEGVTVSVQPIHADPHRVVLALRLEGLTQPYRYVLNYSWFDGSRFYSPVLKADGKELPWIQAATTGMYYGATSPAGQPIDGQGTVAFDTSALGESKPQTLTLQLAIPVLVDNNPPSPFEPVPTGQVAMPTPTEVPPASHTLPFSLSFEMPFDNRRVVTEVGQAVESGGVKMTLDRVSATASEARISLHYTTKQPDAFTETLAWDTNGVLQVGSGDGAKVVNLDVGPDGACPASSPNTGDCLFSYTGPSLAGQSPIDCTLTVTAQQAAPLCLDGRCPPPLAT